MEETANVGEGQINLEHTDCSKQWEAWHEYVLIRVGRYLGTYP